MPFPICPSGAMGSEWSRKTRVYSQMKTEVCFTNTNSPGKMWASSKCRKMYVFSFYSHSLLSIHLNWFWRKEKSSRWLVQIILNSMSWLCPAVAGALLNARLSIIFSLVGNKLVGIYPESLLFWQTKTHEAKQQGRPSLDPISLYQIPFTL